MTPELLRDLATLFVIESEEAADDAEADRLSTVARGLYERADRDDADAERFRRDVLSGAWHADDTNAAWGMA